MPRRSAGGAMREITGITWNHTRGFVPMVATAQRFCELNPEVQIIWEKRSLQAFADAPLPTLAAHFDLLVIDHPSIGEAAKQNLLLPLNEFLSASFLNDQATNSVGRSHASYNYEGKQYALAIDAAAPIAGWRADLLDRFGARLPETWDDLLALARHGLVTVPAIPIDSLMNLFMLANGLGAEPFAYEGKIFPLFEGVQSLELLRELVYLSAPGSLDRNPIQTWQYLAESDSVAFCPFAYGYSNYSRVGYAANRLSTGGLIALGGKKLRSTLGGAGLAVSRSCKHPETAVAYAAYTANLETQRTLYAQSGGQPGHLGAWTAPDLNVLTKDFFQNTLSTLDTAWVRPRFPGYIAFQDLASHIVYEYLVHGGSPSKVLDGLDQALQQSLGGLA